MVIVIEIRQDTIEGKAEALSGPSGDISANFLWKCLETISNFGAQNAVSGLQEHPTDSHDLRMANLLPCNIYIRPLCLHIPEHGSRIYEATLGSAGERPYFLHCHSSAPRQSHSTQHLDTW